jgi:glycosyltransferase involved in cell wall biosynthesis
MLASAVGLAPADAKVITIHSGLAHEFLLRSAMNRALAGAALARFPRIVAVSPAVRDALAELGVEDGRISVLPAFCASQVKPGTAPERLDKVRALRRPLLAMAHHPSPVYGRDIAFEAISRLARRLPSVGLALFGPGSSSDELWQAARAARVQDLIDAFGELDHPQALALIQQSDAFLRPTTADGDALSVREALALGVRCVASDAAARPEGTIVFRAGDALDLADKVAEALSKPSPRGESPDAAPALLALYGMAA